MARQTTTPVDFDTTVRPDTNLLMSSGRAGQVTPAGWFPMLPGDSASGRFGIDIKLAEMPRPLENTVFANVQAWVVPKPAHPQFPGPDEVMHAMTGLPIKSLGAADRTPPAFFTTIDGAALTTAAGSDFFKTLGLHVPTGATINSDLIDAFSVIYNFRLAAHSSRLPRRKYAQEDIAEACSLPRAFWPSSRFSRVVPDYETALVVGAFDLDVAAGALEITGAMTRTVTLKAGADGRKGRIRKKSDGSNPSLAGMQTNATGDMAQGNGASTNSTTYYYDPDGSMEVDLGGLLIENSGGAGIPVTLNSIDKARMAQAFAKVRTAYAGNDATGFDNDDTLVSLLMQGIAVPQDQFKRPWLLASQRVPVGFAERFATDAANLDASVTTGRAQAVLNINVPRMEFGGTVVFTVEVLPDRLHERQSDEFLVCTDFNDLPNALRDVQRVEPVDMVLKRRVDAKHATPDGLYGYEPMNDKWRRDFTRLGGAFYQATPGNRFAEQRAGIWHVDAVNPEFNDSHYLAPAAFPHDVFADTLAPAFEFVARHQVAITGLTQFGDVLAENNDDYNAVKEAGL